MRRPARPTPRRRVTRVIGGRYYGPASKELTPATARAAFDGLKRSKPKNHFAVGMRDDVTRTSLDAAYRATPPRADSTARRSSSAEARRPARSASSSGISMTRSTPARPTTQGRLR